MGRKQQLNHQIFHHKTDQCNEGKTQVQMEHNERTYETGDQVRLEEVVLKHKLDGGCRESELEGTYKNVR